MTNLVTLHALDVLADQALAHPNGAIWECPASGGNIAFVVLVGHGEELKEKLLALASDMS